MLLSEYKRALPWLMQSRTSAFVWGHHGIGKSEAVEQFSDENKYKMFNLRLGSMDVGDLLGLGDFVIENGKKVATQFFMPDWLKACFDFCNANPDKWAIIHLDEINRARKDVLSPVFQMVLDYRLHTYEFPKNVYCIASANPPTDDYTVTDISDNAFMDRFCHIKLTPSTDEWLKYAEATEHDSEVVGFIKEMPDHLSTKLEEFSLDQFVKPSRRSWTKVSKLRKMGTPSDVMAQLGFGLVGITSYLAFEEYCKNSDKPIPGIEVLENYKKHKKNVLKMSAYDGTGRGDLLKSTTDDLVSMTGTLQLNKTQADNLIDFLLDIPVGLAYATLRKLYYNESVRTYADKSKKLREKLEKGKAASAAELPST